MKSFLNVSLVLVGLLSFFILNSCIKDDMSDCFYGCEVLLYYSYEPKSQTDPRRGINPKEVEQISVFIFDENGLFVKSQTDNTPEFSTEFYQTVTLETGNYTFVSWANVRDCYSYSEEFIPGETSLQEVLLHFNSGEDNLVTQAPHSLFHGRIDEIEVPADKMQETYTIPVVKNTYLINVYVTGINSANDFSVSIEDRGNKYKFDNLYTSDEEEVTYITQCNKDNVLQLSGSLTTQRLLEGRRFASLKLQDITQNRILVEQNLIEWLILYRIVEGGNNLDNTYEYDIELEFSGGDEDGEMRLTVSINGWKIAEDDYQLSGGRNK